jgi:hypothetical protein
LNLPTVLGPFSLSDVVITHTHAYTHTHTPRYLQHYWGQLVVLHTIGQVWRSVVGPGYQPGWGRGSFGANWTRLLSYDSNTMG